MHKKGKYASPDINKTAHVTQILTVRPFARMCSRLLMLLPNTYALFHT